MFDTESGDRTQRLYVSEITRECDGRCIHDGTRSWPILCSIRNCQQTCRNSLELSGIDEDHDMQGTGGACDQRRSAESWDEMVVLMVKHVTDNHPDAAKQTERAHKEGPKKWREETKPKWDAALEDL